jgi:DNA-binding helix-hairpin-helix protein with protein kinase domain
MSACTTTSTAGYCAPEPCWRAALEDLFVTMPDDPDIDFRAVFLALDAVHGRTSGQVSSRGFLLTRHSLLGGKAPIEVIADPDGPARIWGLVDLVVEDYH